MHGPAVPGLDSENDCMMESVLTILSGTFLSIIWSFQLLLVKLTYLN